MGEDWDWAAAGRGAAETGWKNSDLSESWFNGSESCEDSLREDSDNRNGELLRLGINFGKCRPRGGRNCKDKVVDLRYLI